MKIIGYGKKSEGAIGLGNTALGYACTPFWLLQNHMMTAYKAIYFGEEKKIYFVLLE